MATSTGAAVRDSAALEVDLAEANELLDAVDVGDDDRQPSFRPTVDDGEKLQWWRRASLLVAKYN